MIRPSEQSRQYCRIGALLLAIVMAFAVAGCTVTNGTTSAQSAAKSTKASAKDDKSKDDKSKDVAAPSGSALKELDSIPVKGRAPETGYSRDEFGPAWADTDHNGCDQRNDILRRDLTDETFKAGTHGCVVMSGTRNDPYTGRTIAFRKSAATAIQIDHVVALQNAWVTGAYHWTEAKRESLATDPLNLVAVDGSTNESKGSGDAATWLPPHKSYRCAYVARQVAVKAKYGAWMTKAEKAAIRTVLTTCPKQPLPAAAKIPLGDGSTAPSGGSGASGGAGTVSPGAYCDPEGATGKTESGTRMKCSSEDGDRPRWRSA